MASRPETRRRPFMATSPCCFLLGTAGLFAARADEFGDLLFGGSGQVQAGASKPADRSREGAKPVVLGRRNDRDREMASGDDRPRPSRSEEQQSELQSR